MADAGTRREVQRRAVEAGGWWVRTTYRSTDFHAKRGGGERVQERGDMTTDATNGGGGKIEGEEKIQKNGGDRWGGRVRIKCVISHGA